jgi:TonB family protein
MSAHEWWAEVSSEIWPVAFNHLWQSTLFFCLAAVAVAVLRKAPARARYTVWLIASLKFAIPSMVLAAILAWWGIDLTRLLPKAASSPGSAGDEITVFEIAVTTLDAPEHSSHSELTCTLSLVWAAGFALVLGLWLRSKWELSRMLRPGTVTESGPEAEAVDRVRRWLGMTRAPKLILSPRIVEPGVLGVFRPKLLFPKKISEHLETAELEAVIMHELVHVQRRDNLAATLHMVLCAVFWFHPLVWLIDRRMLADRERACDQEVCRLGGESSAYTRGLLKVLQFSIGLRTAGVSAASGSDLGRRIKQIMETKVEQDKGLLPRAVVIGMSIAVIAFMLAAGAMSRQRFDSQTTPTEIVGELDGAVQDAKGVRRGVSKGVPGGVPVGTPGGVPGGAPGGVPGGAPGGVSVGVPGGVAGGAATYQAIVEIEAPEKNYQLRSESSDIAQELDEATEVDLAYDNSVNPPVVISTARMKVAKEFGVYKRQSNEWVHISDQWALRVTVTYTNNSGQRVRGVMIQLGGKDSKVLRYDRFARFLEPGVSMTVGMRERRRHSLRGDPKTYEVKVVGVAYESGERWGELPPPPPPPRPRLSGEEEVITITRSENQPRAIKRTEPLYPELARAAGARGAVSVEVTIDEQGEVVAVKALSGHPLLRDAAVEAAQQWRFSPTIIHGNAVKVVGTLTFNFSP